MDGHRPHDRRCFASTPAAHENGSNAELRPLVDLVPIPPVRGRRRGYRSSMPRLEIQPATPDRWGDVLELFGENGAYSNCWCTWWLLTGRGFDDASKAERRDLLHSEVSQARQPGLLAYENGSPVGWCAVAPRERYARLNAPQARTYKRFDDLPAWVVTCFYVPRDHRGRGIATELLDAAIEHARSRGATIIEGYPIDLMAKPGRAADLFVGTLAMFRSAGFCEVNRVGDRPLVRKAL